MRKDFFEISESDLKKEEAVMFVIGLIRMLLIEAVLAGALWYALDCLEPFIKLYS